MSVCTVLWAAAGVTRGKQHRHTAYMRRRRVAVAAIGRF